MHLPLFPVQIIMIVQSPGQIYVMSCICAVIMNLKHKCVLCRKFRCSDVCKFYKPRECEKLNKPPYVCNGCSKKTNCMMDKRFILQNTPRTPMKPLEPQAEKESIRHRKVYRNWTSCCHRFSKRTIYCPHLRISCWWDRLFQKNHIFLHRPWRFSSQKHRSAP